MVCVYHDTPHSQLGRAEARRSGSHRILVRDGDAPFVFAFRDADEIGPRMLARISRVTGLRPVDL